MNKRKIGRIGLLLSIPHFFVWVGVGANVAPEPKNIPGWMLWWLLGIIIIVIISAYMSERATPKDTWNRIKEFINE